MADGRQGVVQERPKCDGDPWVPVDSLLDVVLEAAYLKTVISVPSLSLSGS